MILIGFVDDGLIVVSAEATTAREAWKKAFRAARSRGLAGCPVIVLINSRQVGFINNDGGALARQWFRRSADRHVVVVRGDHDGVPAAALLFRK